MSVHEQGVTMEDTASVQAAIHHVDSVLGVAVTVAIFVLNLTVTHASTLEYSFDLGLSITVSVLWGLVGILRQKWNLKLFAWWSVLFCGGLVLAILALQIIGIRELPVTGEFLLRVFSGALSYLFLKLVVVDAYMRRLRKVAGEATIRQYEDLLRRHTNQAIFFPLLVLSWGSLYHVGDRTERWLLMLISFVLLFVLGKWYGGRKQGEH